MQNGLTSEAHAIRCGYRGSHGHRTDPAPYRGVGSATDTPDEEDWPDNSQIPLTYHPIPDIA